MSGSHSEATNPACMWLPIGVVYTILVYSSCWSYAECFYNRCSIHETLASIIGRVFNNGCGVIEVVVKSKLELNNFHCNDFYIFNRIICLSHNVVDRISVKCSYISKLYYIICSCWVPGIVAPGL